MDAKALPPRPNLEQYRKQAKDLLRSARLGERTSIDRLSRRARPLASEAGGYSLADAQLAIAHEHGFDSWRLFATHVEAIAFSDAPVARFERAADAVVAGNIPALAALLESHPDLVRARSTRAHHATLLHYVAANGVEDFRQKSPPNAVAIARMLLESGADVNASANTYGGGIHQTPMNLLVSSVHPARAGVQPALVQTLLDFGAPIEGVGTDGSPLLTAAAFQYPAAVDALVRFGATLETVLAAAAAGRPDLIRRFVAADGEIVRDVPLASAPWLRVSHDHASHADLALIWASALGRTTIVEYLAPRVNIGASDAQGFTALHWAAFNARLDVMDVLLRHRAQLESRNSYGGTVLNAVLWASQHIDGVFGPDGFVPVDHAPVVERLLAAGADASTATLPTGNRLVDALLTGHGTRKS